MLVPRPLSVPVQLGEGDRDCAGQTSELFNHPGIQNVNVTHQPRAVPKPPKEYSFGLLLWVESWQ